MKSLLYPYIDKEIEKQLTAVCADHILFKVINYYAALRLLSHRRKRNKSPCIVNRGDVRDNRYKYVFYTLTGLEQLYDLQQDPYELHNIAGEASASSVYENLYDTLAEELAVRGEDWVKDGKLQIQKKSVLMGDNFPKYKVNQVF